MNKTIYTALVGLLMLTSCAQEEPDGGGMTGDSNRIFFRSTLPTVSETRGGIVENERFSECQATCINPNDTSLIDPATGDIKPYFHDVRFAKEEDGRFTAHDTVSCTWPAAKDKLHFFAYYPSVETMKNKIHNEKFNLVNNSNKTAGTIDYRLEHFMVAPKIADHVDFVAAYSNGSKEENGSSGIALNFSHQLARIEISACEASDIYDVEIAGVRIGNALTEGHFSFSSLISAPTQFGVWSETVQSSTEHIFRVGESIVQLGKEAAPIMGKGGPAMVIPMKERIEAWEGKGDENINASSYTTNKLYFSALLRVTNSKEELKMEYPYPENRDNLKIVYLAVDNDGIITDDPGQLYKGFDGTYYTDRNMLNAYIPPQGSAVKEFGWAAVPVAAKWDAGKIYTYTLNYTAGMGWHDPSDPKPGDPIISDKVSVNVNVAKWVDGENSDLTVPRR